MNNFLLTEEWIPIPFVSGECSLSSIEYNAADLSVALWKRKNYKNGGKKITVDIEESVK